MERKLRLDGEYVLTYNQGIQFNFEFMNNLYVNLQSLDGQNSSSNTQSNFVQNQSLNIQSLSDQSLYSLCKTYGLRALEWRRKFTGLLPEVFKRKLYEKKGFGSIFEFAKKLAGLSEKQVRLAINLKEKFSEMPKLESLLVNGEVSINKLARIASIASAENQEFLAEKVKILSKSAVETLVRDENQNIRSFKIDIGKNKNGLFEPEDWGKFLPGQTLDLSSEVHQRLLELQQKGLDLNKILLEFLRKREEEIAQKKEQVAEDILRKAKIAEDSEVKENQRGPEIDAWKAAELEYMQRMGSSRVKNDEQAVRKISLPSRYIPVAVKEILHEEHGTKCAIRNCKKTATTIHHTRRFSLSGSHDPHYLAPLCKDHHELAHACDMRYGEVRAS